ncbi:hypothetical protein PV04_07056 [Phialophora macrospora]|uniref:Uncharacterized protein n=1 Tax=Phialophora macrospora TaxID=1851006 RepID=A0A0D2FMC0_9EURO|nr:hypothetical protein PV04_07056 [Phialophora macrospora]
MTRFNLNTITGHSEGATTTGSSEPAEISPHRHHDSKLGHVIDSIRHALAHEHEKLPSDHTAEQQPSQQQDQTNGNNGSLSPALQAVASSKLNENNMGEDSHESDKTWGWPGLGTFKSHESATSQHTKSRTGSEGSEAHVEERVEAATFEAIDNAAESETFGWPGLGTWATPSKK